MKKRDWTLSVCTVTGLALLSVWSDLVGHGSGFFASADAVQEIANARVLFLAGLTLSTAFYMALPRMLKRFDRMVGGGVATVSIVATVLFSFPEAVPFLPVSYLCAGCLFLIGVGYGWLAVHLVCEVAYEDDYVTVVMILAASLVAKTILTSLVNMYGPASVHVAVAVASPIVCFAMVAVGQRALDRSPETLDLAELPKVPEPDRRVLLVLLILLPVLRALVRGLSKMGYWGSEYEVENIIDGLGFLIVIALMIFFARITLVEEQGDDMITRFLPPFLVILGGFFLLDPQVGHLMGLTEWTSYILTTFVELFSAVPLGPHRAFHPQPQHPSIPGGGHRLLGVRGVLDRLCASSAGQGGIEQHPDRAGNVLLHRGHDAALPFGEGGRAEGGRPQAARMPRTVKSCSAA